MGRKAADYTGRKFNRLTGLRNTGRKVCRGFVWAWQCDCGAIHEALPGAVTSGSTQSCGCLRRESEVISSGDRFGRLVAIEKTDQKRGSSYLWRLRCDCGAITHATVSAVRGSQKSCGCAKREAKPNFSHGHCAKDSADSGAASRTYRSWLQMKARCAGREEKGAAHYKGRGIVVCERWADSFENFLADMGQRPAGTSLERENNDGNYEPDNCKWATRAEQARNTRRTVRVQVDGVEMCLKDACAARGVPYDRIQSRIRLGASPQEALDRPSSRRLYRRIKI